MENKQKCIRSDFEFSADDLEFLATTYSTRVRDIAAYLSGYKLERSLEILKIKEEYLHLKKKNELSTAGVIHLKGNLKSCEFLEFCHELLINEGTPLLNALKRVGTPLLNALKRVFIVNTEVILELIDVFDDLSHKDQYGRTSLHLACLKSNGIEASYMIRGTIIHNPMKENEQLYHPFQKTVIRRESGQTCLIQFSQDKNGNTPLHLACQDSTQVKLVERLVECDYLSIFAKNKDQFFPLKVAYHFDNFECLNILLQKEHVLKYRNTNIKVTQLNPNMSLNDIIESYLQICRKILHYPVATGNSDYLILDAIFEDIYKSEKGLLPVETWFHHMTKNLLDNESWYVDIPDISHEQLTKVLNICLKGIEVRIHICEVPHKVPALLVQQVEEMLHECSSDIKVVHCIRYTIPYYHHCSLLKYCFLSCEVDTKSTLGRTPFDVAYSENHFTACAWLMVREQCSVYLNVCKTNDEKCRAVEEICTSTLSSFPKHCMIDRIVPGDTLLHVVASIDNATELIHYLINVMKFDVSKTNSRQEYPLHIACRVCHSAEVIKLFMNCDLKHRNIKGDSPFDLLFIHHHCEFVYEIALTLHQDFLTTVLSDMYDFQECNYEKNVYHGMNTPLHIATRLKIKIDSFKQRNSECFMKWSNQRNILGELPLHIAAHNGDLDSLKLLCNTKNCSTVTNKGNTAVHEFCMHTHNSDKHLEVLKFLHEDLQCNARIANCKGQTALHICCQRGSLMLVEYLLDIAKLNANVEDYEGYTPLMLTPLGQHEVVRLLVQHSADTSYLYKQYKTFFENYSSEKPPSTPLNVIVVGNHTSGKSTLIEALKSEGNIDIVQAEPLTAGIIPSFYQSQSFGTVMWYDLAGHSEYYASHEAVLNTIMCSCLPLVLLLVDIRKTQAVINQEILYWLQFLQGLVEPKKFSMQPHIAVVFSFKDELQGCAQEKIYFTKETLRPFFEKSNFDFHSFSALDCRKPDSNEIKDVRAQIQKSYSVLCDKTQLDFLLHCFYAFLFGNFKNEAAVTIQRVLELTEEWIATGIDPHFGQEDEEASDEMVDIFYPEFEPDFEEECPARLLPKDKNHILPLCERLSSRGHVMLFKDSLKTAENSWIILNKDIFLKEVNGSLFAPKLFKQHYKNISTSTGAVSLTKLCLMFSKYDSVMLSGFLTYLEFCNEISDKAVLELLQLKTESCSDRYFFFPGLVSIEKPKGAWKENKPSFNKFGWILYITESNEFFTSRFIQVLLLRIAFSYPLLSKGKFTGLQSFVVTQACSVWKNGLFWQTNMGLDCLIEVTENSQAIVLMLRTTSKPLSDRCLAFSVQYRSNLISKIIATIKELCPSLSLEECILHPNCVQYPPMRCEEAAMYSIRAIAGAVCTKLPFVPSISSEFDEMEVTDILDFEPFIYCNNYRLFDESRRNLEMSDEDLQRLSASLLKASPTHCAIYYNIFSINEAVIFSGVEISEEVMYKRLCQWRNDEKATYGDLHKLFGKYSIFGERDFQVLGGCKAVDLAVLSCSTTNLVSSIKVKPTLPMLIAFKCKDGTTSHVLEKIGCKYSDFGILLLSDDDGSKLGSIEKEMRGEIAAILREIVKFWLQGKGRPVSWTTLVNVLQDIGLPLLAEDINSALQ